MSAKRGIAITSARVVGGVLAVGLLATTIVAATLIPLPSNAISPVSEKVAPVPLPQSLVCTGPALALSNASGQNATEASSIGSASLTIGSNDPDVEIIRTDLEAPDNLAAGSGGLPVGITSEDTSEGFRIAAAQSQTLANDDFAGFAAAACAAPVADQWVVGGATNVGRTSFLVLNNPGEVAAEVELEVFDEVGPVDAPGATGITVLPGSQRIFSLAGLAPAIASPIVHVVAAGGTVAASIQHAVVRGLEPGGFEIVGSSIAPATSHVLTGVQIQSTTAIGERLSSGGQEDLQPVVRVFVPGANDAVINVTATSERAGVSPITYTLTAAGGVVSDLPIRDVPDGNYSISFESDTSVVLAARTTALTNSGIDFAWYQSSAAQEGDFVIPVATGPNPRLHSFNASAEPITLTLAKGSGEPKIIEIAPGAAIETVLDQNSMYTASVSAPLFASVGFSGGGKLSAYSIPTPSPLAAPVVVYP